MILNRKYFNALVIHVLDTFNLPHEVVVRFYKSVTFLGFYSPCKFIEFKMAGLRDMGILSVKSGLLTWNRLLFFKTEKNGKNISQSSEMWFVSTKKSNIDYRTPNYCHLYKRGSFIPIVVETRKKVYQKVLRHVIFCELFYLFTSCSCIEKDSYVTGHHRTIYTNFLWAL